MNVSDLYGQILVEISTPTSIGWGFIWKSQGVVVTNELLARENRTVVLQQGRRKALADVLYLDPRLDLAFLRCPESWDAPTFDYTKIAETLTDTTVWTVSTNPTTHFPPPMEAFFLSDLIELQNGLTCLELEMLPQPEQAGSPIFSDDGRFVGINSLAWSISDAFSFALPAEYLIEALHLWQSQPDGGTAARCYECGKVTFEKNTRTAACQNCGNPLEIPAFTEIFSPFGIAASIETLLTDIGYDTRLARKGPNAWSVERGSAEIQIAYNEKEGYIIGDAFLCLLPDEPSEAFYDYLLRQNYVIKGLNLNIRDDEVVLSLMIYERDLNLETGVQLLNHLFEMADFYDNILVERYGAKWR